MPSFKIHKSVITDFGRKKKLKKTHHFPLNHMAMGVYGLPKYSNIT